MPQSKPLIWTVLSDLGKVRVRFDNRKTCAALAPHSSVYSEDGIYFLLFEQSYRSRWEACMRGELAYPDYRSEMKRALHLKCSDDEFDRALADVFTDNEPIAALWKELRTHHTRIVTASNVEPVRHAQLIAMGVMDQFDGHCLSYVEKVAKPDPRFFKRALEIGGSEPHETLFVDDHAEFCEVARSLGIHAEVYDIRRHDDFVRRLRERYLFS